jgi:hypothetical protein
MVDRYDLEIYAVGSDGPAAAPESTLSLGKPTPDAQRREGHGDREDPGGRHRQDVVVTGKVMTMLVPSSFGVALVEFNACHDPATGRRCSGGTTMVGITSATPRRTRRDVILRHMAQFERALRRLPGVRDVRVFEGAGVYMKTPEVTWVTSYKGNGRATALLKRYKEKFHQFAVLQLKPCRGARCQDVRDLTFDVPDLPQPDYDAVAKALMEGLSPRKRIRSRLDHVHAGG